jgi:hypothetical protein
MLRFFKVIGTLSFFVLSSNMAKAASDLTVQIAPDESLTFSAPMGSKTVVPKAVKPGLFELNYLGSLLPHDDSNPYFLFTGLPCKTCTSEQALYLIRPSDKPSSPPQVTSFVQPGKIFDPKTRGLVMESRAFFGRCLATRDASQDDVYIVFQKEHVDRHHGLQTSVFVANASSDFLREKLIERGLPSLSRTLSLVKMKKCHEIPGRSRLMVLKPHGLNWRNLRQDDGDDEDSDTDTERSADAPAAVE